MNESKNKIASSDGNIEKYLSDKKYIALMPLLEKPLSEVRQIHQNLDNERLIALINFALDWEMKDYWQSLAVGWLESGVPTRESTKRKLEKISIDKMYSQKLRHRVQKLLKENKS